MDMLGSPKMRRIITESYQNSNEPRLVQRAIRRARSVLFHSILNIRCFNQYQVCKHYQWDSYIETNETAATVEIWLV